ncbi:MAG: response regulator [Candidatus Thorarchaeota archaeon]
MCVRGDWMFGENEALTLGTSASEEVKEVSGTGSSRPLRVLVVDDHPLFREAVTRAVQTDSEFCVIGEASDGEEAVRLVGQLNPDIVLLDIGLPQKDGLTVIREAKAQSCKTRVLVLTVYDDAEHVKAALRMGADGYLTKDILGTELRDFMRKAARGEMCLCSSALRHVVMQAVPDREWLAEVEHGLLTAREREILSLVARGLTNRAIAERLSLSPSTVKGYLENVYVKLDADCRTEAVTIALRRGLLDLKSHGE